MYPLNEYEKNLIEVRENVYIERSHFEDMFGNKEEHRFDYNYFINHDNTTKGWVSVFNNWKEQGILN